MKYPARLIVLFCLGYAAHGEAKSVSDHWRFQKLIHTKATDFATGGAEAAFVDTAAPANQPLVVLVDHVANVPRFDYLSRVSWRRNVLGPNNAQNKLIEDSLEKINGEMVYLCHYQTLRGGPVPEETLLRVSRDGAKLMVLSYAQTGRTFLAHAARVREFFHQVRTEQIKTR